MKILHMSDLHIGKSVNGFSMIEEQKHAFMQIISYIKTEQPAAIIIAGDVYDRAIPSVEAVCVFDDFLTELSQTEAAVMLISGNHDSSERLSYASRLLLDKQLYICGSFNGAAQKITLTDNYGELNFWLLPFVKPTTVRSVFQETEVESYDDAVAAAINASDIDYSARNVLVSHQFYTKTGVTPVRSESELNPVGGLDAVDSGIIERFDYVALGHLHGRQSVGAEHIRYCGSPIKYSFSEWRHDKSVTLVELCEKGNLSVKPLPMIPIHDMREIKGELDKLLCVDTSSLADTEDYLRVILTDEDEIVDPLGKLRSVYPNVMSLDFENTRTSIDINVLSTNTDKIERLSPYDLFSEFFLEVQGSVMSSDQATIVRRLLESEGEEEV
jgi:exonuclease SbcD